jgi:predicted RNA-binding Zn-ribbon protein involved in translation (DUF1610 family)
MVIEQPAARSRRSFQYVITINHLNLQFSLVFKMAVRCPSCNRYISPLKASFGKKYQCPGCSSVLVVKKQSSGLMLWGLVGVGLGSAIEHFLSLWFSKGIAIAGVIIILLLVGVAVTPVQVDTSSD